MRTAGGALPPLCLTISVSPPMRTTNRRSPRLLPMLPTRARTAQHDNNTFLGGSLV